MVKKLVIKNFSFALYGNKLANKTLKGGLITVCDEVVHPKDKTTIYLLSIK